MKLNAFIVAVFLLIVLTNAQAKIIDPLPKQLKYQGHIIDALCFFIKNTKHISLTHCPFGTNESLKKVAVNAYLSQRGFIAHDYIITTKHKSSLQQGVSYYKLLGKVNGKYLLYTLNHLGSSRVLSAIKSVEQLKASLQINSLAIGEDVNSGIITSKLKKKIWSIQLTYRLISF